MREGRIKNILETLQRVKSGATSAFGEGREDHRAALKQGLKAQGIETDSTMWEQMMGSNATVTRARELMGMADPAQVQARKNMGLGLSEDKATRIGQVLGTLGSDVVQDRGRSIWWLLNAPQATAQVLQDLALKKHAPNLYKADVVPGRRPSNPRVPPVSPAPRIISVPPVINLSPRSPGCIIPDITPKATSGKTDPGIPRPGNGTPLIALGNAFAKFDPTAFSSPLPAILLAPAVTAVRAAVPPTRAFAAVAAVANLAPSPNFANNAAVPVNIMFYLPFNAVALFILAWLNISL